MFVRMKIGPRKGEVCEMQFQIARELIAAGRAEKFDFDAPKRDPQQLSVDPTPETAVKEPAKKVRRRHA